MLKVKDSVLDIFVKKIEGLRSRIQDIYLFGSRARQTEKPDSDYDLLLIVSEDFSLSNRDILYDAVIDVLLDTGRLISLKIFKEKEFKRLSKMKTPFTQSISKEAIRIG